MSDAPRPAGPRPRRPFHLSYAMGLVAAVALTLAVPPAIMRASVKAYWGDPSKIEYWPPQIVGSITLAMAMWSLLATIGMMLSGRRRLRRAARTWGGSAALASTVGIVGMDIAWVVDLFLRKLGGLSVAETFEPLSSIWWGQMAGYMASEMPRAAGLAVLGAWTILALARVARKPSGWLEIAGFLLGLAWIISPVIKEYVRYAIICRYVLHLFP
jgi:hypothetical protein